MHFNMLLLLVYNDGLYSKTALSSTGRAEPGNWFDQFTAPAAASWAGAGGKLLLLPMGGWVQERQVKLNQIHIMKVQSLYHKI